MALRRLLKELDDITIDPDVNVSAFVVSPDNLFEWRGFIENFEGTPYENGIFEIDIKFPQDYPFKPPRIMFKTKIYHPNVNSNGGISLDVLSYQWSPALTTDKVLQCLRSLVIDPNPDDPLEPMIAWMFKNDKNQYDKIAKEWTKKYANKELI